MVSMELCILDRSVSLSNDSFININEVSIRTTSSI